MIEHSNTCTHAHTHHHHGFVWRSLMWLNVTCSQRVKLIRIQERRFDRHVQELNGGESEQIDLNTRTLAPVPTSEQTLNASIHSKHTYEAVATVRAP